MDTPFVVQTNPKRAFVPPQFKPVFTIVVLAAVGLILAAIWAWNRGAEERAIRHLAVEERRALYDRTLLTLQGPCGQGQPSSGLEAFCREQAEFIVQFPECAEACSALARKYLSVPSK